MNDARAVVGMDRLPWLMDEPKATPARSKSGAREMLGWAVAGLLVVAGASYWVGTRAVQQPLDTSIPSEATVKLPDARDLAEPEVPIVEEPEAAPRPTGVPARSRAQPVHRTRWAPAPRRKTLSPMEKSGADLAKTIAQQERTETPKSSPIRPPAALASRSQLRLWPASVSSGSSGRIVRIGAFGSREQAKLGWRRMQRVYPAVARLPATVVTDRNSRGRTFYRFQIGTTSQAHSEVLCQRMQKMLRFSCAVVGLSWQAKVER